MEEPALFRGKRDGGGGTGLAKRHAERDRVGPLGDDREEEAPRHAEDPDEDSRVVRLDRHGRPEAGKRQRLRVERPRGGLVLGELDRERGEDEAALTEGEDRRRGGSPEVGRVEGDRPLEPLEEVSPEADRVLDAVDDEDVLWRDGTQACGDPEPGETARGASVGVLVERARQDDGGALSGGLEKNVKKYERQFFGLLSSGALVSVTGHRLYDGPRSRAMLKKGSIEAS